MDSILSFFANAHPFISVEDDSSLTESLLEDVEEVNRTFELSLAHRLQTIAALRRIGYLMDDVRDMDKTVSIVGGATSIAGVADIRYEKYPTRLVST